MVKANIVIAIIVICLFVLLAIVGFGIYYIQRSAGGLWSKRPPDEEE